MPVARRGVIPSSRAFKFAPRYIPYPLGLVSHQECETILAAPLVLVVTRVRGFPSPWLHLLTVFLHFSFWNVKTWLPSHPLLPQLDSARLHSKNTGIPSSFLSLRCHPRQTVTSRHPYTQLHIPMKTPPHISLPFPALTTRAARAPLCNTPTDVSITPRSAAPLRSSSGHPLYT